MRQASDAAATDHLYSTFVVILTKSFYISEQLLREIFERC